MNNGRRVELDVTYNNAPFAGQVGAEIESLTYVDNAADDSDSIDITLDAQDSKWLHGWLPEEGATLRPRIIGRDWNGPGDTHVMECGLFILDDVAYPKGTNFAAVTNAQIAQAENWINNYPRKILGYKSSEIVFRECLLELGIAA